MPAAKEIADAKIVGHPAVIAQREKEKAARQSIKLAEADYLPKFGAGVSYGYRQGSPMGADRSDFASVNVTMSLPIFTGARQDRRLSASKFEAAAAKRRMDELLRVLRGNYDAELHAYDLTKERLRNLVNNTLPRAKENVSAAVASYQFDKTDFNALTGAHIAELEVRLQQLRLNVEQEKSLVKLQYLTGGTDHE
jgi:outer membrane protein TolC